MWRWRELSTPDEYGNGSDGLLYKQVHNATDAHLLVACEICEPPGKAVGALDFPNHR
jgi:hypothetical protein